MQINQRLADEINATEQQIDATITLLDEGATVPFIARYRKEVTGGLDDTQLRTLAERLIYLRELKQRRDVVLSRITEQGKLDDTLKAAILAADSKTRLEDLYLPYRPKRRTKSQIAIEAGLQSLAETLLQQPQLDPEQEALKYLNEEHQINDAKAALDGARHILAEQFSEEAELIGQLRDTLWQQGVMNSAVVAEKAAEGAKFADYFDYSEALHNIPSHRALALFRGRNEGVLNLTIELPHEPDQTHPCEQRIAAHFGINDRNRPADTWLLDTVRWAWRTKISRHLDLELKQRLREQAEAGAIQVFADNLRDLLLAAPAGPKTILGLDPGLRTGVKVAVVDHTGKLLATETIYPHAPQRRWDQAIVTLATLAQQYAVALISIGNGTASRETDQLAAELIQRHPKLRLQKIRVSEAGASVYSASALAAHEMPDIDVSLRGAVSIARRLQDPLAELVKIDPKSIGVGQYQHDVNQSKLSRSLDGVVEDCVNAVGVDVNTASAALLSRIAGLNTTLAANIVAYRDNEGAFTQRQQLLKVPRLGAKTYEQAAGFLRIMNGENPLDRSAVHPEAYPLVERILQHCGRSIAQLLGNSALLKTLEPTRFTDKQFGLPTVLDIIQELDKPGRDPRPEFKTAQFKEGVETLVDLKPDMILEGVVTNVTHFGAFVDIGVHQDGLVHISALANTFVNDPRDIVKTGQVVTVKVMSVDPERKRISLSMRLSDDSRDQVSLERPTKPAHKGAAKNRQQRSQTPNRTAQNTQQGTLAEAFHRARQR